MNHAKLTRGQRVRAALGCALLLPAVAGAETGLEAYYRASLWHNADGGLATGSAYLEDAGMTVSTGDDDAPSFFLYLLWNNSTTFSDRYTGDLQGVSNIDAPGAFRVYEAWYERALTKRSSLRIGLYDLNAEFDAIGTAGLFINSSHGIGAEYGQTGRAGPSIFPVTSLAARVAWQPSAASMLRYAVLDGVPGDPTDASRTTIRLGDGDGLLHALEFEQTLPGGLRLGVGGWQYTSDFDNVATGAAGRDDGNRGFYGFAEGQLWSAGVRELRGFARYGVADDRFNSLGDYFGAGLVLQAPVAGRPEDQLGFAVARAGTGSPARAAAGLLAHETTFELTWRLSVSEWLVLQPSVQYVVNPGADATLGNAFVAGLDFTFFASRSWPR